jgi:hypothetical protein
MRNVTAARDLIEAQGTEPSEQLDTCRFIKPDTFRVIVRRDTQTAINLQDMRRVTELIRQEATELPGILITVRAFIVVIAT